MPAGIIPAVVYSVLCAYIGILLSPGRSLREGILTGAALTGAAVVFLTETLGLFHGLTSAGVITGWSALALFAAAVAYFLRNKFSPPDVPVMRLPRLTAVEWVYINCIIIIAAITGFVALAVASNAWDCMTYHLSRVCQWMQNKDVFYFPTHQLKELHSNPWADFAILHSWLLWGSDRLVNMPSFFCMLGSLVGVSLIAREFSLSREQQLFSALLVVTLPIGILQASSAETHYAVVFWLVCFAYYTLYFSRHDGLFALVMAGACLGFAVLSKATAYIFGFPFFVWLTVEIICRYKRRFIAPVLLVCGIVLAINSGQYIRNIDLFGNPLGSVQENATSGAKYINEVFGLKTFTSNIIRNAGLQIGTPSDKINSLMNRSVTVLFSFLNISEKDPLTSSWVFERYFKIRWPPKNESEAGNPIHFLAISIALCVIIFRRASVQSQVKWFGICAFAGICLFCWFLKWQPWNSRLHLPVFVLLCPFVAAAAVRLNRWALVGLSLLLFIAALPYTYANKFKKLTGITPITSLSRRQQYFGNRLYWLDEFLSASNLIKKAGCSNVGVISGAEDWLFPLYLCLKPAGNENMRIEHVFVANISAAKSLRSGYEAFMPDALIFYKTGFDPNTPVNLYRKCAPKTLTYNRKCFKISQESSILGVYLPL